MSYMTYQEGIKKELLEKLEWARYSLKTAQEELEQAEFQLQKFQEFESAMGNGVALRGDSKPALEETPEKVLHTEEQKIPPLIPIPTAPVRMPPMKQAIVQILDPDKVMNAEEILSEMTQRGWVPNSSTPKQYISMLLSSNTEVFEKSPSKGRGYYRLVQAKVTSIFEKIGMEIPQ